MTWPLLSADGPVSKAVPKKAASAAEPPKKNLSAAATPAFEWTGWRGPDRNGRVPWLPEKLPAKANVVWKKPLSAKGLGGVAATRDYVLVSERDPEDTTDVFKCFKADSGKEVWTVRYAAAGDLDWGNSPRATPLIHEGLVYLFGAFGHLTCAELASGKVVWQRNLEEDFDAQDASREWGMCSSPLLAGGQLIVNPGGADASLVALHPKTGKLLWKTRGGSACYGNLIAGSFGGKEQVVGFDGHSLGGWDVTDGKRLWRVEPENRTKYNVPTPMRLGPDLVVAMENNGTMVFRFKTNGIIDPKPLALFEELAPNTHSPVVVGDRVFGLWGFTLYCLDVKAKLKPLWTHDDKTLGTYVSMIASEDRLLLTTKRGELLLIDATADRFRLVSRLAALGDEKAVYAHPALVGSRLYLRGNSSLVCLELKGEQALSG